MARIEPEVIASFLQEGDHFRVTTEKVVSLLPGCSVGDRVIKRSTYNIIIGGALAHEAEKYGAKIETPDWAMPSDEYEGIVEHRSRKELYVLAGLDKKAGFCGRPSFFVERETEEGDMELSVQRVQLDEAQAAEVKKYLPPKGNFGSSFALPLRSIIEIDAPETTAPVPVQKAKDLPWD